MASAWLYCFSARWLAPLGASMGDNELLALAAYGWVKSVLLFRRWIGLALGEVVGPSSA